MQEPPVQPLGIVHVSMGLVMVDKADEVTDVALTSPVDVVLVYKTLEVEVRLTSPVAGGQPLGMVQISVGEVLMGV